MYPLPPFFRCFLTVFIGLFLLFWGGYYAPQLAKKQTLQSYSGYLAERHTLLTQSRLFSIELLHLGKDADGFKRGQKIVALRDILNRQITLMAEPEPASLFFSRFIPKSSNRIFLRTTIPDATHDLIVDHREFLTQEGQFLDALSTTPQKNMEVFLTSSSSVAFLTAQTNLLLRYQFWLNAITKAAY